MKCPKCGYTGIEIRRDARGVAEAHCEKCGAYIKKLSTGEVLDYFENLQLIAEPKDDKAEEPKKEQKPPCRYCTEHYFYRRGSIRTRAADIPIQHKFCPMCGREIQDSDWNY